MSRVTRGSRKAYVLPEPVPPRAEDVPAGQGVGAGPQRLHHRLSGPVLWPNWTRPAGRRVMLGTLEQWTLKVCVRLPARPAVPRAVPFTTSPHRSLRTSRLTAG